MQFSAAATKIGINWDCFSTCLMENELTIDGKNPIFTFLCSCHFYSLGFRYERINHLLYRYDVRVCQLSTHSPTNHKLVRPLWCANNETKKITTKWSMSFKIDIRSVEYSIKVKTYQKRKSIEVNLIKLNSKHIIPISFGDIEQLWSYIYWICHRGKKQIAPCSIPFYSTNL